MKINASKESSEWILSATKQLTNFSQNYFTQSGQSGSVKKLVSAFLLIPVIIPTAITAALIACTYFFVNAVSAKENDFILSKLVKGILRFLIYVAATIILVPCIILNLAVSLIPSIILFYANKNVAITNDKNGQTVINTENDSEYNKLVTEETLSLVRQSDNGQEQSGEVIGSGTALTNQCQNSPQTVQIISRNTDSEENIDQITVISSINDANIRDGNAIIRTVGNENNVTMKGIIIGDADNQSEGAVFDLKCEIVSDGLDLRFGCSVRTGDNKIEVLNKLMEDENTRTMLSGSGGILSIEQPVSQQRPPIQEV